MKKAIVWKLREQIKSYREAILNLEKETGMNAELRDATIFRLTLKKEALYSTANMILNDDIDSEYEEFCKGN